MSTTPKSGSKRDKLTGNTQIASEGEFESATERWSIDGCNGGQRERFDLTEQSPEVVQEACDLERLHPFAILQVGAGAERSGSSRM